MQLLRCCLRCRALRAAWRGMAGCRAGGVCSGGRVCVRFAVAGCGRECGWEGRVGEGLLAVCAPWPLRMSACSVCPLRLQSRGSLGGYGTLEVF